MRWLHAPYAISIFDVRVLASFYRDRTMVVISIDIGVCLDGDNPDIDGHVVSQVLVSRYEGDAVFILEADTTGGTIIDTVEILDGRDNRISGVVRVYLNTHRDACPNFGILIQ